MRLCPSRHTCTTASGGVPADLAVDARLAGAHERPARRVLVARDDCASSMPNLFMNKTLMSVVIVNASYMTT